MSDLAGDGAATGVDGLFRSLMDHWVDTSPVMATQLGDHRRDGELDEWGPGAADATLRVVSRLRDDLRTLDVSEDPESAGDALLLADALDAEVFELDARRSHEHDPAFFLGLATGGVHELIRRDDLDPVPLRGAAAARAAQVPRLLDQAKVALTGISAPHREVALLRVEGAVALFDQVLPAFAPEAHDAGQAAADACRRFGQWLAEDDAAAPDWRLGEERWGGALRLALGVRMAPEQLWQRAQARLAELADQLQALAAAVLGDQAAGLPGPESVRAAVAMASQDQAGRDCLVTEAAGVLADIRSFIRQQGDFPLPEPDTLRVEEVPAFMQGAAVAFFVPAPPLETAAPHTYFLSPVPDAWDDDRAASFLREYNVHALRSVGIHEAYPGHYVQLAFAQRHPRLLRRTLWNSAFAEGWAVYAEHRMIDAGFGGDGPSADFLRLISAKMELRSVVNALLDQGLHVHGWSDEEGMALMVDQAYQEPAEATTKLLRAKVTAGQLSTYFVGGEEMADLRRDAETARGPAFDAARFHTDVLGQGTPSFPVLRRALFDEVQ